MARYVVLLSYSADSAANLIRSPSDRSAAVTQLLEAAGGRMVEYYWMLGPYDVMVIVDLPDNAAAASMALAVTSSRGFSRYESYPLFQGTELPAIEERARGLTASFEPPNRASS